MGRSGSKLVVALASLALALGAISWWYRYQAAHRATEFWGAHAAQLIARSDRVEVQKLDPPAGDLCSGERSLPVGASVDLSQAHGMAHLRYALMCDRNYVWDESVDPNSIEWRWLLKFDDSDGHLRLFLSSDLTVIGKCKTSSREPQAISCRPMAQSLASYFRDLKLRDASTPR